MRALIDQFERTKASIRAKVEHPFRVLKQQFGYVKVRYRGLQKNTAQIVTLFATCRWPGTSCWPWDTTDSRHQLPVAENVLNRQFAPEQPNRVWAGDITYIRTGSGWLYLAVVIDLFSRKRCGLGHEATHASEPGVPGDGSGHRLSPAASGAADALGQGQPQYASAAHTALLARHGLVPSMSRKGNCWDNAVSERFFLNLKMERVWQRQYANHLEATQVITDYIVHFYNAKRLHSTLGYVPPNEFEGEHIKKTAPDKSTSP